MGISLEAMFSPNSTISIEYSDLPTNYQCSSTAMSFQVPTAQSECNRTRGRRPTTNYVPSPWGDRFLHYEPQDPITQARIEKEIEELKGVVRNEISAASAGHDAFGLVKLIDAVERLGLAYHFETDMEQALSRIHGNHGHQNDEDLYKATLRFRLLRQHGFNVSTEIFTKFTDDKGKFKESLKSDIQGMLGLYQAADLRLHGEDILDEALAFTSSHLKATVSDDPNLAAQVSTSLKQQPFKGIPRLEHKKYIYLYQGMASHNQTLLRLAKLDFHQVQSLHKKELSALARWWNETEFGTKLTFGRNRLVESFFWAAATYFEPKYSLARKILSKVIAIAIINDDIYDAYGTIDELTVFTQAIQRWDINCMNDLQEKMQLFYKTMIEVFREMEDEMAKQGNLYRVDYAKEAMKTLTRGYLKEAQCFNENYIPTVEEHMELALLTCAYPFLLTVSFVGMGNDVSKETFEWMSKFPKLLSASASVSRWMDDIVGHKFEQERGHAASGVECYMKQYGVSEEEAYDVLQKRVDSAWKDINAQFLKPTEMPIPSLMPILNFARIMDVLYKVQDSLTHVTHPIKDGIKSLVIEPVQI